MATEPILENQQFANMDFDSIKIRNGEDATPNVINRLLVATDEGDIKLSEAIAFTDRSSALTCTPNTVAIANFDTSLDTRVNQAIYTTSGSVDFAVRNPLQYRGAFWSFQSTANLINTLLGTDSSLSSLNGWSYSGNNVAQCTLRSDDLGMRIRNFIRGGSTAAGDLVLATTSNINVTTLTDRHLSCGITLQPLAPFEANGVSVSFGYEEYNASSTLLNTASMVVSRITPNTMMRLEGQILNTNTTNIRPFVKVHFANAGARIDFRVRDFCLYNMEFIGGYSETNSNGASVSYSNLFNTVDETQTVLIRPNLNATFVNSMGATTANIITLQQETTGKLLMLALASGKIKFRYLNSDFSVIEDTPEYTVEADDMGFFTTAGIRYGVRTEAFFVDGNGEIHVFVLGDHPDIAGKRYNVILGNFDSHVIPLNSPLTELRIDKEWFNNEQVKVVYLSSQPFADYKETALTSPDIQGIIDNTRPNLLVNPDGRLYLNHWSGFPTSGGHPDDSKFTNIQNDAFIGTGFLWKGGAASTSYEVFSEFINIKPDVYTLLRCKIDSITGSAGRFGVGVAFYTAADATTKIGSSTYIYADPGTALKYYGLKITTPATALYARVSMYIGPDVVSSRITWSRMKFEQGDDFTVFEDSGTRKYALYAPSTSSVSTGSGGGTGVPVHYHHRRDILDWDHTHVRSEITDFAHAHNREDILDFAHRHNIADIDGLDLSGISLTGFASVISGMVYHGQQVPLPSGYTESQCKWIVSPAIHRVDDDDVLRCYTSSVPADNGTNNSGGWQSDQMGNAGNPGRYVTCWTSQRGPNYANYITIGIR